MQKFARQLKYERTTRSWSQEQLAQLLGTTRNNVSRWERGLTFPSLYFRQQLSELFGKPLAELQLLPAITDTKSPAAMPGEAQHELPASPALTSPFLWRLPASRNPLFTGRDEVLVRLHAALNEGRTVALTQVQAITGLGGIGKTQTALEYAYRYASAYQAVFWLRAETRDLLLSNMVALAEVLQLREKHEQRGQEQREVVEFVKGWLQEHSGWLLILDNLEELSLIQEALPAKIAGHILVTTRAQSTGAQVQRIDLDKMEPEEGGALFLLRRAKRLGPTDPLEWASAADSWMAAEIYRLMDGLPLALDQAGAYIEEAGCSLAHYVDLLHSHLAQLLDLRDLSGGRRTDHPHSVRATFTLSFERIAQINLAAIELLYLCAFLHPDTIPEEMLTEGATHLSPLLQEVTSDPLLLDATIAGLRKYSLLRRHPEARTLSLHRLVQTVIKDGMDEPLQRQWAQRVVQVVNDVFPHVELWETSSQCRRYFPQAQVCVALIETWDIVCVEAGQLLTKLSYYLYELSQHELTLYVQAEPLLKKALAILTPFAGTERHTIAEAQRALGWFYAWLANYAQAEVCYQQALATLRDQPEPDHRVIAACLIEVARTYEYRGNDAQAEPLYQHALDICETLLGPDDMDVAACLHNLGRCYLSQGKYTQAEPLLLRALAISERAMGMEHPITVGGLHTLARLYLAQKLYARAEPLLLRTLELRQKVLKPGHRALAPTLNALGKLYLAQRQYAQAEPLLREAYEIRQQALGAEHPQTRQALEDLSQLYTAQSLEGQQIYPQIAEYDSFHDKHR